MISTSQQPAPPAWAPDLLRRLGARPVPADDLAAGLRDQHPAVTVEAITAHLQALVQMHEVDDGWVDLLAAADGAVLTHTIDEEELAHGLLVADGDLDLWARLATDGLPVAGGGLVRCQEFPDTVTGAGNELVGPPGWLEGCRSGDLVGLRLRHGTLELSSIDDFPRPDTEAGQQVVECGITLAWAAFAAYLEVRDEDEAAAPDVATGLAAADAVATHPGVLDEPLPPLGLMLRIGGLVVDGGIVSLPGLPDDPDEAADLSVDELRARVAVTVFVQSSVTDDTTPLAEVDCAHFLGLAVREEVVDYLAELVEREGLPEGVLGDLRRAAAMPAQRAVVALLAARTAEGEGEPIRAEQLVTEALQHDPDLAPALLDAAEYAATRGDVVAAEGFLKRAGAPSDDPRRAVLARLVVPPATATARNQPCPCGSGRKYKLCCLRHAVHPLHRRAPLVHDKLTWWAVRSPQMPEVDRLEVLLDHRHPQSDLIALDLATFDGGLLSEYLEVRGDLLPADERALVEGWRAARLTPYEVTKVRVEVGVTLRPLLGGEPVELLDRALSTCVRRLDLVVARILHDGQKQCLISPPVWVPRSRRHGLMSVFDEYTPEALAEFLGPQPPPKLTNREGQELVFCEAEYEVPDPEPAWQRLGQRLTADEPDRLTVVQTMAEGDTVRLGSVRREGGLWIVEADSRERLAELHKLVREAAPDAELVDESTEPAEQALADRGGTGGLPGPYPDAFEGGHSGAADGAAAAAITEYFRQYEQRWLDEPVPALDGKTPRQAAAAGGAALAELRALLDDIEWRDDGQMSADRLRAALGLA